MAAESLLETRMGRLFIKLLRLQRFDLTSKFCDDLLKVLHTRQFFTDGSRQLSRDPVVRDGMPDALHQRDC